MWILIIVLTLIGWAVQADGLLLPNINILEELGKIITMQTRVSSMENEMERLRTENEEQAKELKILNDVTNDTNIKMDELIKQNQDLIAELQKLKNMDERIQKLEETLTKVLSDNEALKTLVQDSQNKLETVQKEKEAKKIAFSAGLLASGTGQTGPLNTVNTLEYKKVFSNVGSAYDSNTGIFTAPIKGVYYFRFYAHSHGGIRMAVSLLKNGETQCSVHAWKLVGNGNGSNGVVLTLEIGDKIYTQLWEGTWVYDDPASYTSFSGFLLFPL